MEHASKTMEKYSRDYRLFEGLTPHFQSKLIMIGISESSMQRIVDGNFGLFSIINIIYTST